MFPSFKYSSKNLWLYGLVFFLGCSPKNEDKRIQSTGNPAIDQLNIEIGQNPEDGSLYAARGEQFYLNESYDEALSDLQQAVTLAPDIIAYWHLLADIYLDYYKSRQALETLEACVEKFPGDKLSRLKLAEFQLILKMYEASLATLDQLEIIDPQLADVFFMRGLNYKELEQTDEAIANFQKAVQLDASLVDAWINLGQLFTQKGDPIARQYFDTAIEIAPGSMEAMHAKAFYLQEINELEASIALFREMGKINPQYDDAFYNAGLVLLDMDSLQAAYDQFDIAVKTRPMEAKYYYFRGVASELMGLLREAVKDYEQCLVFDSEFESATEGLERLNEIIQ